MHLSNVSGRKSYAGKVNEGFGTTNMYLSECAGVCGGERWRGWRTAQEFWSETQERLSFTNSAHQNSEKRQTRKLPLVQCIIHTWSAGDGLSVKAGDVWQAANNSQAASQTAFTSRLRCASLKDLYKPEDAFNETSWIWFMHIHTWAFAHKHIK